MRAGLTHAVERGADMQVGAAGAGTTVETERAPLVAGAVVGREHDEGVREFAVPLEVGEQSADALVDVLDHRGEGGHATREILATVRGEAVPRGVRLAGESVGDGVVLLDGHERKRRQHRLRGDEPQRLHAREALGAQDVPAAAISRHVTVDRSLRRLHGEVRRGMREVEEPRLVLLRPRLTQELEGVVGEDVGDVELAGLIGEFGRRTGGQAHVLVRIPLVVGMGLQVLVAVIGVEAALDRPGRTHVPLADHPGAVAGSLQELRDGDVVVQQVSGVGGTTLRRGLGGDEITDARFVRMQAGDERGARRTATRGRVDLLETRAGPGETVEVRGRDLAAVAAEVRVAEVVGQDDEDVGTTRLGSERGGQNQPEQTEEASHRGASSCRRLLR